MVGGTCRPAGQSQLCFNGVPGAVERPCSQRERLLLVSSVSPVRLCRGKRTSCRVQGAGKHKFRARVTGVRLRHATVPQRSVPADALRRRDRVVRESAGLGMRIDAMRLVSWRRAGGSTRSRWAQVGCDRKLLAHVAGLPRCIPVRARARRQRPHAQRRRRPHERRRKHREGVLHVSRTVRSDGRSVGLTGGRVGGVSDGLSVGRAAVGRPWADGLVFACCCRNYESRSRPTHRPTR